MKPWKCQLGDAQTCKTEVSGSFLIRSPRSKFTQISQLLAKNKPLCGLAFVKLLSSNANEVVERVELQIHGVLRVDDVIWIYLIPQAAWARGLSDRVTNLQHQSGKEKERVREREDEQAEMKVLYN